MIGHLSLKAEGPYIELCFIDVAWMLRVLTLFSPNIYLDSLLYIFIPILYLKITF